MSFITSFAFFLITVYLQFTTALADIIIAILPATNSQLVSTSPSEQQKDVAITDLQSAYKAIPSILLENNNYQSANALSGTNGNAEHYVENPLEALVNIYCQYRRGDMIRAVTGTGFFIDADGVILTNAHVAQFLLLEGIIGNTQCTIRTGNPAVAQYQADLLYISPAWMIEHANLIEAAAPQGTGERDYALLYITNGLNNKPLPASFPSLKVVTDLLSTKSIDSTVTVSGYPAESAFKSGDINAVLTPQIATTSVAELMTFGSNYADVISIKGSILGEQGASGGPIVTTADEVIGLVSTRGDDAQFGSGSLRAITLSYIDRTMIEETSLGLRETLQGNLPLRSRIFKEAVIPVLQSLLRQEL